MTGKKEHLCVGWMCGVHPAGCGDGGVGVVTVTN